MCQHPVSILTVLGTGGIGKTAILNLARHNPGHIVFTGRNVTRADEVIAEARKTSPDVNITFLECDQASFESIEAAAKKFLADFDRLDVLFANAGIMAVPPGLTKDGYEMQFGTNHMGHALLLKNLLPLMTKTADSGRDVRLVTTTSTAFLSASNIAYDSIKTPQDMFFGQWRRYAQSKLANILYSQKIAELYPKIMSCSIQPGVVSTDLIGTLGWFDRTFITVTTLGKSLTPDEGSYNMCWVATTKRTNLKNGAFYEPVGWPGTMSKLSQDDAVRNELWEWTQKELEEYKV